MAAMVIEGAKQIAQPGRMIVGYCLKAMLTAIFRKLLYSFTAQVDSGIPQECWNYFTHGRYTRWIINHAISEGILKITLFFFKFKFYVYMQPFGL